MLSRKTLSPSPVYERLTKVPKHPNVSKIPKHPFVSMTKMDRLRDYDAPESVIVKNDLYEVEFRRSRRETSSSASSRNSYSAQSHYDVPRRFLSKSDPEISQIYRPTGTKDQAEVIYDVPRIHAIDRPRSSVYEDAMSLRRRSADLACRAQEFHYDIVRPRICKVYFNRDAIRSDSDLICAQRTWAF